MFSEVSDIYCLFNYYGRLLKDQILSSFRRDQTTRKLPYPEHLRILPEFPTGRWLEATVSKAKQDGLIITEEEEEQALGCDWHVSQIYLAYIT